ncbi:MAG: hypothetical protein QMB52_12555, partial [Propionivibrio sp.]
FPVSSNELLTHRTPCAKKEDYSQQNCRRSIKRGNRAASIRKKTAANQAVRWIFAVMPEEFPVNRNGQ